MVLKYFDWPDATSSNSPASLGNAIIVKLDNARDMMPRINRFLYGSINLNTPNNFFMLDLFSGLFSPSFNGSPLFLFAIVFDCFSAKRIKLANCYFSMDGKYNRITQKHFLTTLYRVGCEGIFIVFIFKFHYQLA